MNLRKDHYRSFHPHSCELGARVASAARRRSPLVGVASFGGAVQSVFSFGSRLGGHASGGAQALRWPPLAGSLAAVRSSDFIIGGVLPPRVRVDLRRRVPARDLLTTQLLSMDILALATMKNAAKCDT